MTETTITRTEVLAQFNKITNAFIMLLEKIPDPNLLNHDLYLYKLVTLDIDKEKLIGDYNNYNIVLLDSQPLDINEHVLNTLAREKILEVYPMERQLTILGALLERIAEANAIECEELKEMNDYINEVKRVNDIRKEYYANNSDYNYMTTEQLEELMSVKYEGGIQEYGRVLSTL